MKTIKCGSCDNEISPMAVTCPKCGHPNQKRQFSQGQKFLAILIVVSAVWWFAGGFDQQVAHDMQKIENKVANDAVNEYEIAKRQGNLMQICVQAMQVSAGYLQAKDEPHYRQWKSIESDDCRRAGLPQY